MSDSIDRPQPKWGAGHAEAMFRQGLKEARNALYPESPIAEQAEIGIYGTKTQGEIADARRADSLDDRLAEANRRDDLGRNDRALEKE